MVLVLELKLKYFSTKQVLGLSTMCTSAGHSELADLLLQPYNGDNDYGDFSGANLQWGALGTGQQMLLVGKYILYLERSLEKANELNRQTGWMALSKAQHTTIFTDSNGTVHHISSIYTWELTD